MLMVSMPYLDKSVFILAFTVCEWVAHGNDNLLDNVVGSHPAQEGALTIDRAPLLRVDLDRRG